jgi:hypothetical protein
MATRAMATAMATTWAMATAARRVGDKEDKGKVGNSNGNGDMVGGQATATAMKWQMVMATRVAGEQ